MAEDILDDLDDLEDDFDDDSMEDILDGDQDDFMDDDFSDDEDDFEDSSGMPDGQSKEGKESIIDRMKKKSKSLLNPIISSKKILIIISIVLVLIICITIGTWWLFFKSDPDIESSLPGKTINSEQDIKDTLAQKDEIIFEDIIDFEPFDRIPLKTSSTMGSCSFNISIELSDPRLRRQVYGMEERIRNIIIGQIGEMTWLELRNPEGKIMLKYNLIKRINSIFPKPTIRNIYFTYFIMQ